MLWMVIFFLFCAALSLVLASLFERPLRMRMLLYGLVVPVYSTFMAAILGSLLLGAALPTFGSILTFLVMFSPAILGAYFAIATQPKTVQGKKDEDLYYERLRQEGAAYWSEVDRVQHLRSLGRDADGQISRGSYRNRF